MNEPWTFVWLGYGTGKNAPGRCTESAYGNNCNAYGGGGDSSTEPYIAAHNVILAHATAVKTYRENYQATQKGKIGMTLNCDWGEPFDANNPDDIQAVEHKVLFFLGWFADPIVFGKYPDLMV